MTYSGGPGVACRSVSVLGSRDGGGAIGYRARLAGLPLLVWPKIARAWRAKLWPLV